MLVVGRIHLPVVVVDGGRAISFSAGGEQNSLQSAMQFGWRVVARIVGVTTQHADLSIVVFAQIRCTVYWELFVIGADVCM